MDNSFVTCQCTSCSGGIEFERGLFDPESPANVECPHCGIETCLYVPRPDEVRRESLSSVPKKKTRVRFSKGTRITLTEEQCASSIGQELIDLLLEIEDDGVLTPEEVKKLNAWLDLVSDCDFPAIQLLRRTSERVIRNKTLTPHRAQEMQMAIERVLPKRFRDQVIEKRQEAERNRPASKAILQHIRDLGGNPRPNLTSEEAHALKESLWNQPSENQLKYIRDLGGTPTGELTRETASLLFQQLLSGQYGPTPRQIMALRFWNRVDLAHEPKHEVTAWMSEFYDEDPRRKVAWELFKAENDDDGSQHDPSWVPIGAGEEYLLRVENISGVPEKLNSMDFVPDSLHPVNVYRKKAVEQSGCLVVIASLIFGIGCLVVTTVRLWK